MGVAMYRFKSLTFQQWNNYPAGDILLENYPYQCILRRQYFSSDLVMLVVSSTPMYLYKSNSWLESDGEMNSYILADGIWVFYSSWSYIDGGKTIYESNQSLYYDSGEIYFAKTIEPSNAYPLILRVRNIKHKDTNYILSRCVKSKNIDGNWIRCNI